MKNATHTVTTIEEVNLAELAKTSSKEKEELEYLDWSLVLLIRFTSFSFEQLLKQLEQAKRLSCTEAQAEIEELLNTRYSFNYATYLRECMSDMSSADGSDNR